MMMRLSSDHTEEVVRRIGASSDERTVLLVADDEMAFTRGGFGGDGPRPRRLFAVVADGARTLTTGKCIEQIAEYIGRKNGAKSSDEGKGEKNRLTISVRSNSEGTGGRENGGVDEKSTTEPTTEYDVRVCEAARFVAELEKGGGRAVELLEGWDYRYPVRGAEPEREGGEKYAVHYEATIWRQLRERLGGHGLLYGLEYSRLCVAMVRGILKCKGPPPDVVAEYVELLLKRAARNSLVHGAVNTISDSGRLDEVLVVPRYEGNMESFDAATREAGDVLWRIIEDLFLNSTDEEGSRNLRFLARSQIVFLEEWLDSIRSDSLRRWVEKSPIRPGAFELEKVEGKTSGIDVGRLLEELDVPVTEDQVALLVRSGSCLFNLQTDRSDEDYSIIYITETSKLISRAPPPDSYTAHVVSPSGFAGNKAGEVEYDAKELGKFAVECCKGNPRNIELLFTDLADSIYASPQFLLLRSIRHEFLTGRCLSQYLGFVSERLQRVRKLLEDKSSYDGDKERKRLTQDAEAAASKLLYHAFHKLFGARSISAYGEPVVRLPDDSPDREFIMRIRTARPLAGELHPAKLLLKAEDMLLDVRKSREVHDRRRRAAGGAVRAREVDLGAVRGILDRVRLLGIRPSPRVDDDGVPPFPPPPPPPPASPRRARSASSASRGDDVSSVDAAADDSMAAVQRCLAEAEDRHGVRIIYAAESSSRSIGTAHGGSDRDVAAVYVHPRDKYFSMVSLSKSFRESFPARGDDDAAGEVDVDITLWEARHAFRLLASDNLTVLEAFSSPIVYRAFRPAPVTALPSAIDVTSGGLADWDREVLRLSRDQYDRRNLARGALGQCESNFRSYIERPGRDDGLVLQKKYIHVARKILLLEWLLKDGNEGQWPPPLPVVELVNALVVERRSGESYGNGGEPPFGCLRSNVRAEIISMLRPERRHLLQEYASRRPVLDAWITSRMALFKEELRRGSSRKETPKESPKDAKSLAKWDELLVCVVKEASVF